MAAYDRSPEVQSHRPIASAASPEISPTQASSSGLISSFRAAVAFNARKGQTIISPGQACTHIYFLASGRVQRVGLGLDGHEVVVDEYGPGELFGLEALIWSKSRFPAVAVERSVIKVISLADFETLVCNTPTVAMTLAQMMAARLAECHSLLYEFAHRSLQERIISALHRLARNCGVEHKLGILLERPIPQRELARLVGASRSRVSLAIARLIRDFRLAKADGRYILLLDVCRNTTFFPVSNGAGLDWMARNSRVLHTFGITSCGERTGSSAIRKETGERVRKQPAAVV